MLVVHHIRCRDHHLPDMWQIYQNGEALQRGLARLWMYDTALCEDGAGPRSPTLWDEQHPDLWVVGRVDKKAGDWESIGLGIENILCCDVSISFLLFGCV